MTKQTHTHTHARTHRHTRTRIHARTYANTRTHTRTHAQHAYTDSINAAQQQDHPMLIKTMTEQNLYTQSNDFILFYEEKHSYKPRFAPIKPMYIYESSSYQNFTKGKGSLTPFYASYLEQTIRTSRRGARTDS